VGSNIPPLRYTLGSGRLKRVRFSARVCSHAPSLRCVFSGVSDKRVLPVHCLVCGCVLNGDNRSDVVNVCKFCQHSMES
jgi:hypothetical protein